jgi:hypothetical protein
MQPIKLFKIFLSLIRWHALSLQGLIFSENQGGTCHKDYNEKNAKLAQSIAKG